MTRFSKQKGTVWNNLHREQSLSTRNKEHARETSRVESRESPTLNSFITASMVFGVSFKWVFELLLLTAVYARNRSHSPCSSSRNKVPTNHQNGRRTAKNCSKGRAIQNST